MKVIKRKKNTGDCGLAESLVGRFIMVESPVFHTSDSQLHAHKLINQNTHEM